MDNVTNAYIRRDRGLAGSAPMSPVTLSDSGVGKPG